MPDTALVRVEAHEARHEAAETARALSAMTQRLEALRAAWWHWRVLLDGLGPVALARTVAHAGLLALAASRAAVRAVMAARPAVWSATVHGRPATICAGCWRCWAGACGW